jgi:hypothetical protein
MHTHISECVRRIIIVMHTHSFIVYCHILY